MPMPRPARDGAVALASHALRLVLFVGAAVTAYVLLSALDGPAHADAAPQLPGVDIPVTSPATVVPSVPSIAPDPPLPSVPAVSIGPVEATVTGVTTPAQRSPVAESTSPAAPSIPLPAAPSIPLPAAPSIPLPAAPSIPLPAAAPVMATATSSVDAVIDGVTRPVSDAASVVALPVSNTASSLLDRAGSAVGGALDGSVIATAPQATALLPAAPQDPLGPVGAAVTAPATGAGTRAPEPPTGQTGQAAPPPPCSLDNVRPVTEAVAVPQTTLVNSYGPVPSPRPPGPATRAGTTGGWSAGAPPPPAGPDAPPTRDDRTPSDTALTHSRGSTGGHSPAFGTVASAWLPELFGGPGGTTAHSTGRGRPILPGSLPG
jgi:hypothetical protein